MDGVHDMGGMHGFGSVDVDDDAAFHEDWERQLFGTMSVLGLHDLYTHDEHRKVREQIDAAVYLRAGYYTQRLIAFERLLVEHGVLTPAEIEERLDRVRAGDRSLPDHDDPALRKRMREAIERNPRFDREPKPNRFEPGDAVVVRNDHPAGHTRCPRYVRRAVGTVREHLGTQVFADANAEGEDRGEPLYAVEFSAEELWGETAVGGDSVVLELWEPYLARP